MWEDSSHESYICKTSISCYFEAMKKLILSIALMAFAVATRADEPKCCADKAATCPFAKSDSKKDGAACKKETAACCKSGEAAGKKVVQSPKAAGEARK
jgi:hypothetical protein